MPSQMCEMSERLVGYLYGELSAEEASAFEAHMATCARCAQDVRDFERVRRALGHWHIAPGPHLEWTFGERPERVRFRYAAQQFFRAMPIWGRLALGAAMVLLVLALFNIHVEWTPTGGFQFRASLFPERVAEPTPISTLSARERQQLLALIEERIRESEARQQQAFAAQLEALAERMRREQHTTLAGFAREWETTQRAQWAILLRELERRRYGALTFADLFFPGNDGN